MSEYTDKCRILAAVIAGKLRTKIENKSRESSLCSKPEP
jgi:hypothetical protein